MGLGTCKGRGGGKRGGDGGQLNPWDISNSKVFETVLNKSFLEQGRVCYLVHMFIAQAAFHLGFP